MTRHASLLRSSRPVVVAVALTVGLAACGDGVGPDEAPVPITELPRPLTAAEREVVSASTGFGLELVGRVVAEEDRPNVLLSPLSASMALGMTLNGADGVTYDGMRDALGFQGLTRAEINGVYRDLIDLLVDLDPAVRFDIANSIWARDGVPFHDAFLQAVGEAFDARAEVRDFMDPATLDAINGWVSDATGGMIEAIVESLPPDLVMLLVNAIYFDGSWTTRFDATATHRATFTRADASTVPVDMMSLRNVTLPFTSGPGYDAVELPYGGGAFSMVVAVPGPGGSARELLAELASGGWDGLVGGLREQEVAYVAMPKLDLEYDTFLNEALVAMGMQDAFDPSAADFSRMTPLDVFVSFVRQKTALQVDERGTKAAAVTVVGVTVTSIASTTLVADRPYVVAIRERLSGTLLFLGVIGDPTA